MCISDKFIRAFFTATKSAFLVRMSLLAQGARLLPVSAMFAAALLSNVRSAAIVRLSVSVRMSVL